MGPDLDGRNPRVSVHRQSFNESDVGLCGVGLSILLVVIGDIGLAHDIEEGVPPVNRSSTVLLDSFVALGVGDDDRGDGLVSGGSDGGQSTSTSGMPRRTLSPALTLGLKCLPSSWTVSMPTWMSSSTPLADRRP